MSEDDSERSGMIRRYAGIAGAAVGVIAAGAAAAVLAERKAIARRRASAHEPLGSVRGQVRSVVADDGLELYAELDEATSGDPDKPGPTLVFIHGYALTHDCWHFQRLALRGVHRMVFYDQRSHGRSARSRSEHCTFDQLGRDLAAVLDQVVGAGPVVLIGHSMGGMTIMALAEEHQDWFGARVVGVGLMSTSAGGLEASALGLPGLPGRLVRRFSPAVMATLARAPNLIERSRRVGSDLGFVVTRKLAFGTAVPVEYVDFTDEMLAATPIDVVADFFPGFDTHHRYTALDVMARVPTMVLAGGRDQITPISHGREIARLIPAADFVELPEAGHMVLLEFHDEVTKAVERLVVRAEAARE